MNKIIKYAIEKKITDGKNKILNTSLENGIKEDRVINIMAKEVSHFIIRLMKKTN
jgi:hypothetical protein